jgi:hypothetical protein
MIASRRGFLLGLGSVMTAPAVIKYSNLMPVRNRFLTGYIYDDFTISASGEIRYVGDGANYTVMELHSWITKMTDPGPYYDSNGPIKGTPIKLEMPDHPGIYTLASHRDRDKQITLNAPFNIDDAAARYLHDGSITQYGGDEIYDSIRKIDDYI